MIKPIRKAVIPVAGLGTRMLPATKAIPKELLPVYDRPIIEHVVKEAIAAGITEIILVTRSGKEAIENHFDAHYDLEHRLEKKGRETNLGTVKNIIPKDLNAFETDAATFDYGNRRGLLAANVAVGIRDSGVKAFLKTLIEASGN